MRVYLSGPISRNPFFKDDFGDAERLHRKKGFNDVYNPADLPEGQTQEWYMRQCLAALVECDRIYMLKGWERSVGARCEHLCAVMCGLEITYQ